MSVLNAARVEFQSLGKIIALNIRRFVVNVLSVEIKRIKKNMMGNLRVY